MTRQHLMTKRFRLAVGLWITPDFSDVEAGRGKPPRINHDLIAYGQLRDLFKRTFSFGPDVDFLVPNDTVDQVTAHMRMGMFPGVNAAPSPDLCACRDFGASMLELANYAVEGVIDVRNAWALMHSRPVRDRAFAPPPSMLPFVVMADDFEDAMIWHANTRPVLGLPPFDPIKAITGEMVDDGGGRLPAQFMAGLQDIFGCPFAEYPAMTDRLAMDKPPAGIDLF